MPHLETLLTRENVERALEDAFSRPDELRKGTHYAILFRGREFGPKALAKRAVAMDPALAGIRLKDFRHNSGIDELLPYYERLGFTVAKRRHAAPDGGDEYRRMARLCYNEVGWTAAVDISGKSDDNHEGTYGYGHEEWLFELDKLVDGYHYGFIEGIRPHHELYEHNSYDVIFFTVDGRNKKLYWAGRINPVDVITKEEADRIKEIYKANGWLANMEAQVKNVQRLNPNLFQNGFSDYKGLSIFNVRFRPTNVDLRSQYLEIPGGSELEKAARYSFLYQIPSYLQGFRSIDNAEDDEEPFEFVERGTIDEHGGRRGKFSYKRKPKIVDVAGVHVDISNVLTDKLTAEYGEKNVTPNHPARFLDREIDIAVRHNRSIIFYEIKTYPDAIACVREAIGQLLEYAHWQNSARADQWIIVAPAGQSIAGIEQYLRTLRKRYALPIFFQTFDFATGELSHLLPSAEVPGAVGLPVRFLP